MKTPPDPPSSMERHSRKCAICTHPGREAIDQAFLHRSHNPNIVKDYNLPSLSSLYRHAHATGLWLRRQTTNGTPNRDSNRESKAASPEPNSNRESLHIGRKSNRENNPGFGIALTPEIQRMLIGK
jgi:hypothetical protein